MIDFFIKFCKIEEKMANEIISRLKCVFVPCQENKYLPKFLEKKFLNYYLVFLLILKIISIALIIYLPRNIFFADITKTALFNFINGERKNLNLPVLKENSKLEEAAYLKAKDILEKDYFSHWSPEGTSPWYWFGVTGYNYQSAGENLAIGFLDSEEVYQAWMESPSHKANLLNPKYIDMGIAVLKGDFAGNEVFVVVQLFGNPKISEKPPVQEEELPVEEVEIPSPTSEKEILPAETEEKPAVELKKVENLTFNFVHFANFKYHRILEIVIYLSLTFLIFSLLITIYFDIFVYREFVIDYKELIPRTIGFLFLLVFFVYFDKLKIIQLIPHEFLF